jgi:hypothetical protein
LAETKVADKQNSLKIRSPNLSVGTNPSTIKLLGTILLSRTCAKNLSVRFVLATPIPMSIALWIWMQHGYIQKKTYRARVSYAVAYQVYNIKDQVLTPFPHSFHSIPFSEPRYDPGINIPPSPLYYHTIAQSTGQLPLSTVSRPVAPGYDRHSLVGKEEKDSSHYLV